MFGSVERTMKMPPITLMLALLVTAAWSGCVVDEDDDAGTGTMTVYVKDAPTDEFREIWLRFNEVLVHRGEGNETEDGVDNETEGTDNETDGWITVLQTDRAVNLLNFSAEGSKAFLGNGTLEAGRYTQIRIHVTEAWGIRASDDENVTITVSSGTAKVVRSFEIEANATTQVVLDLDLDRSLVRQGGPGGQGMEAWRLTPVIGKVDTETVENDPQQDAPDGA